MQEINMKDHAVLKYFEEISRIPRGSCNEKQISDYLLEFARVRGLTAIQDSSMNIVVKKPATPGYEGAPTVIIQGHLDMVCEMNKGTSHDFTKDPIKLRIDGDMLYAENTTLGADNGIAIAYGMALMDAKDIPHPALEFLFTVEEETSMKGALELDAKILNGKLLINIDSEEEGKLLVSCSGGSRAVLRLPIEWKVNEGRMNASILRVHGMKGGHSGMEIDKGRGNSNKILGRVLSDLVERFGCEIAHIEGGMKSNAIPREAEAEILFAAEKEKEVEAAVGAWQSIVQNELKYTDADVKISMEKPSVVRDQVFADSTKNRLVSILMVSPSGIQAMSMGIKDLVESSTNLGVVKIVDGMIKFENEVRSSIATQKQYIINQFKTLASLCGCQFSIESDYPGWEYQKDSYIRNVFEKVHKEKYGKAAEIVAIHAGLECGVFCEKIEGLDAVSFGPDTFDVHTPQEHVSIPSVIRMWEYLQDVLKEVK